RGSQVMIPVHEEMEELVDACHDRQGDESRVQDRVRLIRRAVFTSDSGSVTEGLVFRCQCACMSHQSPPDHDGSWRSGTHSANHVPERIWYEQIGLRRGIYGSCDNEATRRVRTTGHLY